MEIACTRSSLDLFAAKQAYLAHYKKSLEEDVAHHKSGDFRKLLVPLVSTFRYEGDEVNMMLAKSEAKILRDKISDKDYAHEEVIRILTTRSKAQLRMNAHWKKKTCEICGSTAVNVAPLLLSTSVFWNGINVYMTIF